MAPYSLRATDFPTVSTPLRWEELDAAPSARALWFAAGDVLERVREIGEPRSGALELRQRPPG